MQQGKGKEKCDFFEKKEAYAPESMLDFDMQIIT
jgi:dsDNA-binding SOS-regulon protein